MYIERDTEREGRLTEDITVKTEKNLLRNEPNIELRTELK